MYGWITLLYSRNQHNFVNWLYFNKIKFEKVINKKNFKEKKSNISHLKWEKKSLNFTEATQYNGKGQFGIENLVFGLWNYVDAITYYKQPC